MPEEQKTFSESWYRVCDLKIALRPQVKVHRQYFRGEQWVVLQDPYNNQFFRLRPEGYDFIARLRPDRTVQEVWDEALEGHPDTAPGQQDVIQMLAQLYHANLLHYNLPHDSVKLFERYKKRRQKEIQGKLLSVMFARFPLWDPDDFLRRTMRVARWMISIPGLTVWLLVVGTAINLVIQNFADLKNQADGILAPGNLPLLYLGMVVIKVLHEFGHAYACRRFGGEVHTMGVMLLVFTPIPYMDATASWGFRNRWKRVLVGGAGMIVEIFVAALATFVWARTGDGLIHSLAYNMMFIASVSTVLFNINPLLRFDGYYILSDLADIPNLHQRSRKQLRHIVEKYAFGYRKSTGVASSRNEASWLVVFGMLSGVYRIIVFAVILLFVADKFLLLGLVMVVICVVSWVFVPAGKLVNYLSSSPHLDRTRGRAIGVLIGTVSVLLLLLNYIPFPNHFTAPGILQVEDRMVMVNNATGYVRELIEPTGQYVEEGQALLRLENHELALDVQVARAQLLQAEAMMRNALLNETADMAPIQANIESVNKRIAKLEEEQESLVITARQAGYWVAPDIEDLMGMQLKRGTPIGEMLDDSRFYFTAIVRQHEAARLFEDKAAQRGKVSVRLRGQSGTALTVTHFKPVEAEQTKLPSASLGWLAGGEIAIDMSDPDGLTTAEPFFEVRADVLRTDAVEMLHGRSGRIRFTLEPEPALRQWYRAFRQLLQERYKI
jgi:putative peptide zinc metalloprotease protein